MSSFALMEMKTLLNKPIHLFFHPAIRYLHSVLAFTMIVMLTVQIYSG